MNSIIPIQRTFTCHRNLTGKSLGGKIAGYASHFDVLYCIAWLIWSQSHLTFLILGSRTYKSALPPPLPKRIPPKLLERTNYAVTKTQKNIPLFEP